jgi:hypothetical protein
MGHEFLPVPDKEAAIDGMVFHRFAVCSKVGIPKEQKKGKTTSG